MLGVDTNVLVRFLADDDDVQSAQAKQLLGGHAGIYLSMLVMAETFNVLTKVRKFPMRAVHESFREVLSSPAFTVENSPLVARAIEAGEAANCGFSDALIALQNEVAGCDVTATFDHRASRLNGMQRVEDML